MKRIVVLDFEGGDDDYHIVEVGAVEIIDGKIGQFFHRYVRPPQSVNPFMTKIHGLTNEFLADKPTFKEIEDDFLQFIGDSSLVCHSSASDKKYLRKELSRAPHNNSIYCSQKLFRYYTSEHNRNISLDGMCEFLEVPSRSGKKHSAIEDAQLTAICLLKMMERVKLSSAMTGNIDPTPIHLRPVKTKKNSSGDDDVFYHIQDVALSQDGATLYMLLTDGEIMSIPTPPYPDTHTATISVQNGSMIKIYKKSQENVLSHSCPDNPLGAALVSRMGNDKVKFGYFKDGKPEKMESCKMTHHPNLVWEDVRMPANKKNMLTLIDALRKILESQFPHIAILDAEPDFQAPVRGAKRCDFQVVVNGEKFGHLTFLQKNPENDWTGEGHAVFRYQDKKGKRCLKTLKNKHLDGSKMKTFLKKVMNITLQHSLENVEDSLKGDVQPSMEP